MNSKDIKFLKTAKGGMFYFGDEANPDAQLDFSDIGTDRISADSTEVKPKLQGHGVAKELVLALIDYANQKNLKIIPVCSYVVAFFKKNVAYHPVLAAEANF